MHWSKRFVFLLTLLAFLSNMAFALPYNLEVATRLQTHQKLNQAIKHHTSSDFKFLVFEAQEESEEFEIECQTKSDLKKQFTCTQFAQKFLGYTFHQFPDETPLRTKYYPGAIRNWNWSTVPVTIYFQVFRI